MGFATGFTGGVTLTLSLAYLSLIAHQRNREAQSRSLRAQALALQSFVDPLPLPLPPKRSEVAAAQREASVEVAKQRWNSEVENAARWVQKTDWDAVRDGMEGRIAYLWAKATGQSVEEVEKARHALQPVARRARTSVELMSSGITEAARGAFDQASEAVDNMELSAENRALDARLRAKRVVEETKASAQGAISATLDKGRTKALEIVDKAKTAVEEMTGSKAPSKLSPVQHALLQRYEKPTKETRTAAQVLKERYRPMEERDNTVLRGL